ncbi:alpha/beta hydrolase [Cysteiniphilum halobium]|uniref:alpha/beta hydrolase n=1 Tax=Cysteiniphilum halobium TaxID=2219059 RepID=UPI000E6489F9|nr:alpha/beta fold hydrolase [Cysteiniphilum halobium]
MQQFFIKGESGVIETVIDTPKENIHPAISVVICHPHPLFQGTMNNKVITTIAKAFNNLGIEAVRFNYRGVGQSQGHYAEGVGELQDTLSVVDNLLERKPKQKIILAGFSFGGSIAYKAATHYENDVKSLLTIAPAVVNFPLVQQPEPKMPWCLIQGIDDEIVSYTAVCEFFTQQTTVDATFIRLNNVGHFFHGQLIKLRKHLEQHYQNEMRTW